MDVVPRLGRALATLVLCAGLLGPAASCASVRFERDTPTSGTFHSTAWAFTLAGFDFPSPAVLIARGNASESGLPNLEVRNESVQPYLGRFDWLLDLIMIRRASVRGTWGVPSE